MAAWAWLRRRPDWWVATAIFIAAALVRLPAVFRELPPYLFCDEGIFVNDAQQMLQGGGWAATDFRAGGLNTYPVVFFWKTLALFGIGSPSGTALVVSARLILTVGVGAASVFFVYFATRLLFRSRLACILASAALVVSPLVMGTSRYWYPDHYILFFSAGALYFGSRLLMRGWSLANFIWLGVAWGAASSVKYSGLFLGVTVLTVTAALAWRERRQASFPVLLGRAAAASLSSAGAALAVFAAANWSALRYPAKFVADFRFNIDNYASGGTTTFPAGALFNTFVLLGLTAGVAGIAVFVVGYVGTWRQSRAAFALLATFPGFLVLYLATNSLLLHRNMTIAIPFVLPVLGYGLLVLARAVRAAAGWRAGGAALLLALVAMFVAVGFVRSTVRDLRPDPRELAAEWIAARVPTAAIVGINAGCAGPSPAEVAGRTIAIDPGVTKGLDYYVLDAYWASRLSPAYSTRGLMWWAADQRYIHFYGADDTTVVGSLSTPEVDQLVPAGYRIVQTFTGSGPDIVVLEREQRSNK